MKRFSYTENVNTVLKEKMEQVPANRVTISAKVRDAAIVARTEYQSLPEQLFNGAPSKDVAMLDKLKTEAFARMVVALSVNPETYINSTAYTPEEFEKKSKVPAIAKTRNLKAYKKGAELAEFIWSGEPCESVITASLACMIVASQHHMVIPRDVVTRFICSVPLSHVSPELAEQLEEWRDRSMSGGADTQTSQVTLQLANFRAATLVLNGRNKDFMLDVNSPLVISFAQRLNLVPQLERAQKFHAENKAA